MYKAYLKEREGLDVVESKYGFCTYKNRGSDFYIQDVYVLPEFRRKGSAKELADKVADMAKAVNCRILTGSVDSRSDGADSSDKALRAYGMKPCAKEGFMIYYFKEIA